MHVCFSQYLRHQREEETYRELARYLSRPKHPDIVSICATALQRTRTRQRIDAMEVLPGKTVRIYRNGRLIETLLRCEVGDMSASTCFVLHEKSEVGTVVKSVPITADMDLFVQNAL